MERHSRKEPLKILHLEDEQHDSEIVREMLEPGGIKCIIHRVWTRRDFESAIDQHPWDLILSDYSLPNYDGMKALAFARKKSPKIPFILFSGVIGEEVAVQSLQNGATDYVLKHRPARLVSAVRHALEEAAVRKRYAETEQELLRTEKRKNQLESQFLRLQRMESINSLVGGIAHDLNNALVPVMMGIDCLRDQPIDALAKQTLNTMAGSARRAGEMLKQVLAFARGVEGAPGVIRVDHILHEMNRIVKEVFPRSIRCEIKCAPALWSVSGHPTQLHQVLMNLCINARDAMPMGGRLTLRAENVTLNEEQTRLHSEVAPGRYILITVSDSGTGMEPGVLDKIFQPFFTTKPPGQGTGLGLPTSLDIVRNHKGFITVQSRPGHGTEFSVYLPAVTGPCSAEADRERASLPMGHGELILVVDDEASICEITKTALESYGYRTLVASNGPEALVIYAERRREISLVLTDTCMPFMDGHATCHALRQMNPGVKIIATSGNTSGPEPDTSLRAKVNAFLPKPYSVEKLLTTVRHVLTHEP